MEYLQLVDVLYLHQQIVAATGGSPGLRDRGILESALAQPRMTFAGVESRGALLFACLEPPVRRWQ
jgi:death-on-curing protein